MSKKDFSQYDLGGVLKSAHQDENQALRTTSANTSVPPQYSRVELTYNASNSVTNAQFFKGTLPEIRQIKVEPDVAGSLNNTYFFIYSENDNTKYHVWYNVSGTGTDPAPAGSKGIEVPIETNDTASTIATISSIVLNRIQDFKSYVNNQILTIENTKDGDCSTTVDVSTGFTIITTQFGQEALVRNIQIPYDGKTRHIFNTQERKFEVESVSSGLTVSVDIDAASGDTIAVSRHANPVEILDEDNFLDSALSTSIYTEIYSYVAAEDLYFRQVKVKADTLGNFRLKIDGTTKDYFFTSPTERNANFYFIEDLELLTGEELTIEFLPERIRLSTYNFFFRLEGYK